MRCGTKISCICTHKNTHVLKQAHKQKCTHTHTHSLTHNVVCADSCAHISQSPKTVNDIMAWHKISLMSFKVTSE